MACTKFIRHTNLAICNKIRRFYIKGNLRPILFLSANGVQSFQSESYSTVLLSRQSAYKKNNLTPSSTAVNSVLFLSTNDANEKFRVIITNPSQSPTSSTEFIPDVPQFTNAVGDSGNNVASDFSTSSVSDAATDIASNFSASSVSDAALSFSEEIQTVAQIVEPTLSSLGLGNKTPVGLVQMFLEYLHISFEMPWWAAIVACTVTVRILLIPLLVKTQRNAINMSNYMPQLQFLQTKFGEARRSGNSMEATRYASEIMNFMKDNNISPIKNAMMPLMQAPIFVSFFLALRGMAKAPVESMKDGGLWWTTDLTIPDPYYIMPLISCTTLYIVLKIGAESGVKLDNMKMAKYVVQFLPVVAFPFCINFPAAVLYYWVATNFCTLGIVSLLKIKPVRVYFNLPQQKPVDPSYAPPKKGFVKGVKDAYEDQKILAAVEDRRRMDEVRFQKAGTGPIPRTYSYDPTKPRPSNVAAAASKSHSAISTKDTKR